MFISSGDAVAEIRPGLRVLIVEDEFMIAMAVEAVVTDAGGVVVDMAATLEQALQLARSAELDAALLDINLNGKASFEVAETLAARGIPYAFVTGYGKQMVPQAYASVPLLMKPYARSELVRLLGVLASSSSA
ncbi:MAG: response regulator [Rhodospirillales bacterium]|nr:response regulator [Rhodospirillales bacterium]